MAEYQQAKILNIVKIAIKIARGEEVTEIPTENIDKIPPLSHICRSLIVNIITDFGNDYSGIDVDNLDNTARYLTKIITKGVAESGSQKSFIKRYFEAGVPIDEVQTAYSDSMLFCSSDYLLQSYDDKTTYLFDQPIDNYSKIIYQQLIEEIDRIRQSAL